MSSASLDPVESLADREGLDRAYADSNKVYMTGDTLFVAGTSSFGDAIDDIALPFGLTRRTQRYMAADRLLASNPKIRRVVGHSLGGAVALQMQKDHPQQLESRTYGAPVVSTTPGERYRSWGDPVSILDFGTHRTLPHSLNPHSYQDVANRPYTPGAGVGAGSFNFNGYTNLYR